MKGIYFTTFCNIENCFDNTDPGIKAKIRQQFEVLKKNDFDMFFYYAHNESRFYRYVRRMPFFRDKFELPQSVIADSDFIYSLAISLLEFYKEEPEIFLESLNHLKDSWVEGIENITLNTTFGFLVPMINDIFLMNRILLLMIHILF